MTLDGEEQADIALLVEPDTNKLYTGFATLDVRLNEKSESVRLGTPEVRYRWIGGGGYPEPSADEMYAYDQAQQKWIKGFNPMYG
ncbi:hypothetical protein AB0A95_12805 [Micromonospora sp. NPDC049230]|uniref:hypothetical protein n=1 Tax=Micromonospora sp. NPDC049230 TaxID=3155502 RepID=UPI0033F87D6A